MKHFTEIKHTLIKTINIALWVFIGIWYIPVIFAGYGRGLNCGGMLPDGTMWDGFCSSVYFRNQWWLIIIRLFLIAAALWGVVLVKKMKKHTVWYPYAVAGFVAVSVIIHNITPGGMFGASLFASIFLFALLSSPWWGSALILRLLNKKIKKSS